MEKEKNETEANETIDNASDMQQGGDDKLGSESLNSDETVECEDVIDQSERKKDENDAEKLLSTAAAAEGAKVEGVNSNEDDDKEPPVEGHEVAVDVDVQLEQKNDKVQSTKKISIGSAKSLRSESEGIKNGETPKVANAKDKTLPTEDKKVPVTTSQSSLPSQAVTSVAGSRNNSTSTPSTVSSTRSTRSQNPEFLARHRNFLHKVHLASNNITDEELLTDDDESITSKTTSRSSGSIQIEDNSSSVVDSTAARRKRERSASNGTLSPRIPSPIVTSMIGGSASANNSGSSSPAASQMQPATKKRRSTRTDSTGAQQQSPVPAPSPSPIIEASTDRFCWLCHKDGVVINCETCPRVYHLRCIQLEAAPTEDWVCPECITILHAENTETRSRAMKLLSLDQLCNLLKYAVSRMKTYSGAEPFWKAVDVTEFPQYREYVAHPMDLSLLEHNIKKRMYGSTEAFMADTKWVLHNCIIFNTYQSRLTGVAKVLVKICKQEMAEIENCPDCYLNAHTRKDSWFIEVCRKPHILVWAKLKGFPFWPAKVMRTNKEGMVDVRFFGAHDRAWVPTRECFLYSKAIPASARNKKRNNLDACIQEVEQHTKKLRDKFGIFEHAPFRTHFDPARQKEQLHVLLPAYNDDGGGPPSSKRSKFLGGGYAVRTYQRSHQSDREAKERYKRQISESDEFNDLLENRSRSEKRKLQDRDGYSDDGKRASHLRKRTASGRRLSQRSSSSESSQESDKGTQEKKGNAVGAEGSAKSASLIEWSQFEERAAKLTVAVEDEDKQSIASDDRKLRDGDDSSDNVLPSDGAKVTEGERVDKTGIKSSVVERSARTTASEVVKKALAGPSIADKLQEKLLRLEMSSEECKDPEDASPKAICESTLEKWKTPPEEEKKTEEDSENSEDCETSSISAKESVVVKNVDLETSFDRTKISKGYDSRSDSKDSDSSGSEKDGECNDRERSESPVVNKTPLKAEPKRYGKQYSPKVVLYNMVFPSGKMLKEKRSIAKEITFNQKLPATEEKRLISPVEPTEAKETFPVEQKMCKVISVEDSGKSSSLESLLKNRLETSVICKTGQKTDVAKEVSSINPENHSCLFSSSPKPNIVETDKLNVLENNAPSDLKTKGAASDDSSDSGDGGFLVDSSKRTPEHGYSRYSADDNFMKDDAELCKNEDMNSKEQAEEVVEKEVEQDEQTSASAFEPVHEKVSVSEPVQEKSIMLDSVQEKIAVSEPVQETAEGSEAAQRYAEEAGSVMCTEPVSKEVAANESPPDDRVVLCESQRKSVISNSVSNPGGKSLDPVEKRSEDEPLTDGTDANKVSETNSKEQPAGEVCDSTSKEAAHTVGSEDDRVDSIASSNSGKDNFDVLIKSSTQNSGLKVYPAKTIKSLDKMTKDSKMSDIDGTEALLGSDVTITPAPVASAPAEKKTADKTDIPTVKEIDGNSIADKKIKEEPIDPDELMSESSSSALSSRMSSAQSSAKSSPELKRHTSLAERKEAGVDKVNKGKIFSKNLTLAMLEDKDRLASNDSPSSVSEKDGIFPSLFLDPSITITVINDKQSETIEVPISGKSKVTGSDINVNELRASVNLSKDISLTVVGAGYSGHSAKDTSGSVTSLDMECDHESDHDDSRNSSANASSSALIPITVHNNTSKQKKQRPSGSNDSLQARSRARKSFPNRPILPHTKGKPHPELVNGVGTFSNKSSSLRRNSAGTNSNSSDSRRSSYGTSPQEMLISAQQSGGEGGAENHGGSDNNNNNNNPGSAMVVLPPILGNAPSSSTNHIQALRTVNGNIGAPSHIVNGGPDMIPTRMMQVPHNQSHPVANGARISPAGQGPGTAASRMPPQLQPRPPGPLLSQHSPSVQSEAGPVSAELNRHAHKLSDFLRTTVEEILRDLSNIGSPEATIKSLQLELEKLQWRHNQEMAEMKHNTDLIVMEMRASMESERQRAVAETIRQCELDKQRAVEETKKKQWCTNCGKEALFYCCWNTSYCDYPCQQRHWPHHMTTCAQNSQPGGEGSVREGADVQRSSPQASGGSSNHHKASSSQQQQKLQQMVSNGPNGGKHPIGPPPTYSGSVMAQTQRNMGATVGRVPAPYGGMLPVARPANIQVSGYTSSQPSTTASASLTTSTTGNFDFLSPLTIPASLAGSVNTGEGVGQEINAGCETLSRHIVYSVSGNNKGIVSDSLVGCNGANNVARQEQMNGSGSGSLENRISDTDSNFTVPSLQGHLFKITGDSIIQPIISKNSNQPSSSDSDGVKNSTNPPQLLHVINVGSSTVPVPVATSPNPSPTGNVASEQNFNVIPAMIPIMVHQPMVPNVLYQSQVFNQ